MAEGDLFCRKCGKEHQLAPTTKKKNPIKKVFKGLGTGGLIVGGGFLFSLLSVLRFLYIASAGLSMVGAAIYLFVDGSIFWGLVVLLVGTPVIISLSEYMFFPVLVLSILALIFWGIFSVFGLSISFENVWDSLWMIVLILAMGYLVFNLTSSFIRALKNKSVGSFFKENLFNFVLVFFLLYILFS